MQATLALYEEKRMTRYTIYVIESRISKVPNKWGNALYIGTQSVLTATNKPTL